MAFSKKERVVREKDFQKIRKIKETSRFQFGSIKKVKNNLLFSRFAFIVSKKVSSSAVSRNKTRRKISEIVRKNKSFFPKGYDFVIICNKDLSSVKSGIIESLLKKVMMQIF